MLGSFRLLPLGDDSLERSSKVPDGSAKEVKVCGCAPENLRFSTLGPLLIVTIHSNKIPAAQAATALAASSRLAILGLWEKEIVFDAY